MESVVSIYQELKFGEFEHIRKIIHKGNYRMVLEPIEFMDGIDEVKKFIKSCGDDMTRQVKQAFKLMASQFIHSRSLHNEEIHNIIYFEDLIYWLK